MLVAIVRILGQCLADNPLELHGQTARKAVMGLALR
jgi:hypothetical protein